MKIHIRNVTPDDADALAHIQIQANEQAFRGKVPDHCLDFSEPESSANWKKTLLQGFPETDVFVVAETADRQPVGYVWGGANTLDEQFTAHLRQIHILPAYHRQGIGRQLVEYVAHSLAQQGLTSMRVNVLCINPNRAFYEKMGAEYVSQQPYDWDGVVVPECTYGWRDIRTITSG